jgi:hypothetical protein
MFMKVTLYREGGDVEETVSVPAKWVICQACEGCATDRGRSVECDGGGFTASEWNDACDEDPDCDGEPGFARKYFSGYYDRPCEPCNGLGRVQVIDEDLADPAIVAELAQAANDDADYRALCAAERRMGA